MKDKNETFKMFEDYEKEVLKKIDETEKVYNDMKEDYAVLLKRFKAYEGLISGNNWKLDKCDGCNKKGYAGISLHGVIFGEGNEEDTCFVCSKECLFEVFRGLYYQSDYCYGAKFFFKENDDFEECDFDEFTNNNDLYFAENISKIIDNCRVEFEPVENLEEVMKYIMEHNLKMEEEMKKMI